MKIAVIGAGIVGVTTAYELGLDGHAVTVFERRGAVAEESSFATAGVLAPGLVAPWARPGQPARVLAQWFKRHTATTLRWPLGKADLAWIWRSWRDRGLESYLSRRAQMHQLSVYSQSRQAAIAERLRLEFDRTDGCLLLLRTERELKAAEPGLQLLRQLGVKVRQLDAAQARTLEPALHAGTSLAAAIACPGDGVGNCRHFALMLRTEAQGLGVQFRFGTPVQGLSRAAGGRVGLSLAGAREEVFESVVICAGAPSVQLLRPLGLRPALCAIHGHSISATVREPLDAPRSGVIDHRHGIAIVRQGQRIRVAGGAELGGSPGDRSPRPLRTLYAVLQDWFPAAASMTSGVQEWKGTYPMVPGGRPLVGDSGVPGIWLNIGHGDNGWVMACGSARVVADLVLGHAPDIDPASVAPSGRLG